MNLTQSTVDSMATLVAGRVWTFWGQMLQNGAVVDLTGKTVTATIRQLRVANASLGTNYDDIAVTAGNPDVTAANGGMQFTVSTSASDFLVPTNPTEAEPYFVQYTDVTDNYTPQLVIFYVRKLFT